MKRLTLFALSLIIISSTVISAQTKKLTTDEQFKIYKGKVTMRAGTDVTFHPNGLIKSGTLAKPLKYTIENEGTIIFSTKKPIYFTKSGQIEGGYLEEQGNLKTRYGNFIIPKDGWIAFYENGAFRRIDLQGINLLKGLPNNGSIAIKQFIIYSDKGRVEQVYLAGDTKIKDYTFKEGSTLNFHEQYGTVRRGMLANDYTQKLNVKKLNFKKIKDTGKKYNKGHYFDFNEHGDIK